MCVCAFAANHYHPCHRSLGSAFRLVLFVICILALSSLPLSVLLFSAMLCLVSIYLNQFNQFNIESFSELAKNLAHRLKLKTKLHIYLITHLRCKSSGAIHMRLEYDVGVDSWSFLCLLSFLGFIKYM